MEPWIRILPADLYGQSRRVATHISSAPPIGVGGTRLGLAGYLIGLVLGMSFVSLAGGALSYRYGVDTVDAGIGGYRRTSTNRTPVEVEL